MGFVRTWYHQQSCFLPLRVPQCVPHCDIVLLLDHCYFIENNSTGKDAAIPLFELIKLLVNINEWISHVQEKNNLPQPLLISGLHRGMRDEYHTHLFLPHAWINRKRNAINVTKILLSL